MMTPHFTRKNTPGYSDDELFDLNAAWEQIVIRDEDDVDHMTDVMLLAYDAGDRGDALLAWFWAE